jgi:hypothetical protein
MKMTTQNNKVRLMSACELTLPIMGIIGLPEHLTEFHISAKIQWTC